MKKNKNDRTSFVPVNIHDLRVLLFWASVGVKNSMAGSYRDALERDDDPGVIRSYAEHIKFFIRGKIRFKAEQEP